VTPTIPKETRMRRYTAALCAATSLLHIAAASQAQDPAKTSKPTGANITIYNQNFAVVKERRSIDLRNGRNAVTIDDVAALIDPTSVHFKSITAPNAVTVREQNYRYDLINPTTLLNKSVGKRVSVHEKLGNGQIRDYEATIVTPLTVAVAQTGDGSGTNTVYNGMVLRMDNGYLVLNPTGEILLHEMPPGLVARPQLAWLVDSDKPGLHDTEISYMTNGVTWKADYVVVVSADDKMVDITGWVTLDNKSGASYINANLQLMAGDVRRVQPPQVPMERGARREMMDMAKATQPQFAEEGLFEYHLYTLDGATTVLDNEQKQMSLLDAHKAAADKKFVYDGRKGFWGTYNYGGYYPGEGYDTTNYKKVNVMMEVRNSKPTLGIPLPKGKMRLYKADSKGGLQFIGEDEIDHTPKDEMVRLYVGDTFDMVGEHKRTNFRRISDREVEESFEVTLRNHRKEDSKVSIIEHMWQDWRVTAKSSDFIKKDAHTAEFIVTVPKDGETKVTYTVRTKW
jgi:hypothetical protein